MPMSRGHQPRCVLVTGGAGFIGSNFLLRMVPRYPEVTFLNLDKLTYAGNLMNLRSIEHANNYAFVRGDVADMALMQALFAQYHFDSIVHFAAESHVDRSIMAPVTFVHSNTVGTVTLLEAARQAWTSPQRHPNAYRFLHVSTDEVFGSLDLDAYFTRDTPYDPRSPYSASKAAADHFVRAYAHTYELPVVISNCSNNYGPYQFPEKLIPLVISRAVQGQAIPIYGKGANVRDWLHVEDHCDALDLILHRGIVGDTYLVGGNNERTNLDLVRLLLTLVDDRLGHAAGHSQQLITFVADRPGHDFRYAISAAHLQRTLGWQPRYSLESGLRQTVAWYLDHRDWLQQVIDRSYRDYFQAQYGIV